MCGLKMPNFHDVMDVTTAQRQLLPQAARITNVSHRIVNQPLIGKIVH